MIEKIKPLLKKKLTWVVIVVVVAGGAYIGIKKLRAKDTTVRYVTAPVTKGTITSSVSGTGQVSASNQIDIKPAAAAKVTKVSVTAGQQVKANDVLAQLDAGDQQKAVRDARTSLETAQLALDKTKQSADALTMAQAQDALTSAQTALDKLKLSQQVDYTKAQETRDNAKDAITTGYQDGFNSVSDAFLDLPTLMLKLDDILNGSGIADTEHSVSQNTPNSSALLNTVDSSQMLLLQPFVDSALADYKTAKTDYDKNFADFKTVSPDSDQSAIDALLSETLDTTRAVVQAINSASNMYDRWVELRKQNNWTTFNTVTTYQSNLGTYAGQASSHLSALTTQQTAIKNDKQALIHAEQDLQQMDQNNPLDLVAAQQAVTEKQDALDKLQAGPDAIDLQTQELAVQQRQNALSDAEQKLADYTIRAPFDGTVAKIDLKAGDTAASGTAAFTIVTTQQVADISLNEVDVVKVKVGQKATLTFSAIDGLDLTGEVAEVDTIGTVTQNVVNYSAKILFDTQDNRVKPGMSVSVTIITDVKQDVLTVPSAAVKGSGDAAYVQVLVNGKPQQRSVQVGLSSDTDTEVSGDIKEGEQVVTQTITPTAAASTTQRSGTSVLQGLGGGGAVRVGGGLGGGNAGFGGGAGGRGGN